MKYFLTKVCTFKRHNTVAHMARITVECRVNLHTHWEIKIHLIRFTVTCASLWRPGPDPRWLRASPLSVPYFTGEGTEPERAEITCL